MSLEASLSIAPEQVLQVVVLLERGLFHLVEVPAPAARLERRRLEYADGGAMDPHGGRTVEARVRVDELLEICPREEATHRSLGVRTR
jgi:hypothetical protein